MGRNGICLGIAGAAIGIAAASAWANSETAVLRAHVRVVESARVEESRNPSAHRGDVGAVTIHATVERPYRVSLAAAPPTGLPGGRAVLTIDW